MNKSRAPTDHATPSSIPLFNILVNDLSSTAAAAATTTGTKQQAASSSQPSSPSRRKRQQQQPTSSTPQINESLRLYHALNISNTINNKNGAGGGTSSSGTNSALERILTGQNEGYDPNYTPIIRSGYDETAILYHNLQVRNALVEAKLREEKRRRQQQKKSRRNSTGGVVANSTTGSTSSNKKTTRKTKTRSIKSDDSHFTTSSQSSSSTSKRSYFPDFSKRLSWLSGRQQRREAPAVQVAVADTSTNNSQRKD